MLDEIKDFFLSNKKEKVNEVYQLPSRYNSEVFRVNTGVQDYIIKRYINKTDSKDRIQREVCFLSTFSNNLAIRIPRLYFYNNSKSLLCESFLQGTKTKSSPHQIYAILEFIKDINSTYDNKSYQLLAKDAIIKNGDLYDNLRLRSEKWLNNKSEAMVKCASEIMVLVKNKKFQKKIDSFFEKKSANLLSPSDIGPHNMLFNSSFVFFDFEYAGIDSNIKLGLDLVTQPDIDFFKNSNSNIFNYFREVLGFSVDEIPRELIGLFKLKWLLIQMQKYLNSQVNDDFRFSQGLGVLDKLEEALSLCYRS